MSTRTLPIYFLLLIGMSFFTGEFQSQERKIESVLAQNNLPMITIWNEAGLSFGNIGNPQQQINILGNAADSDGSISSLTYKLNSGPSVSLDFGPNNPRLVEKGDFNISLPTVALLNGQNNLLITATDNEGLSQNKSVLFSYQTGRSWPLPYQTDWSAAGNIQNQAQIVDGRWQIKSATDEIYPEQIGYDRLVAVGDRQWKDYEVTVPITIHNFYPVDNDPGGVGVIVRWQGHTGAEQPPDGWYRIGAYGYYSNRSKALSLRLNEKSPINQAFSLTLNKTYIFRLKVESTNEGGKYSFKVWEKGQEEPPWDAPQFANIVGILDRENDMTTGSVLLVAHRTEATFGNVLVCPLNKTYSLTTQTIGAGKVTIQPKKNEYYCGETVTVTAQPSPGWYFSGWNGTANSVLSKFQLDMLQSHSLTARFVEESFLGGMKIYLPGIFAEQ